AAVKLPASSTTTNVRNWSRSNPCTIYPTVFSLDAIVNSRFSDVKGATRLAARSIETASNRPGSQHAAHRHPSVGTARPHDQPASGRQGHGTYSRGAGQGPGSHRHYAAVHRAG